MALSSHPQSDIGALHETIVHHFTDLINDTSVMQLVPRAVRLELQTVSHDGRVHAAENLLHLQLLNPDLQAALARFSDRCSTSVAITDEAGGLSPIDWQLPAVNPHFVGREKELERIHASLLADAPRSVVISGFDGMGKSTFARKAIAHADVEARYNIVWVPCNDLRDIAQLRRRIGQRLGGIADVSDRLLPFGDTSNLPTPSEVGSSSSTQVARPARRSWADYSPLAIFGRSVDRRQRKRLLVVLDGLDSFVQANRGGSPLEHTLLQLQQKATLITTSMTAVPLGSTYLHMDVHRLSDEHASVLFGRSAPPRALEDPGWERREVEELVWRFHGYPLAIKLAAQQVTATGGVQLLKHRLEQRTEDDEMDRLLHVTVDNAARQPKIRLLVRLLAYWPKDGCPLALICTCLELRSPEDAVLLASPLVEQGLLECVQADGVLRVLDGISICDPYRKRLRRLFPLDSKKERDAVQYFCLNTVFEYPALSRGDIGHFFFQGLDPIFRRALQDTRDDEVFSALNITLKLPRGKCYSVSVRVNVGGTELWRHPLGSNILELAAQQADRLQRTDTAALLKLIRWESGSHRYLDDAGVDRRLVDLDAVLEIFGGDNTARGERACRARALVFARLALRDFSRSNSLQQPAFRQQALQYLRTALLHTGPLLDNDEACFPCSADEAPYDLLEVIPLLVRLFESADDFAGAEESIFQLFENSTRVYHLPRATSCDCVLTYKSCVVLAEKACVSGATDFAARFLYAVTELCEVACALQHGDFEEVFDRSPLGLNAPFWSLRRWGPMLRAYLPRDERTDRFRERLSRMIAQNRIEIRDVTDYALLDIAEAALVVCTPADQRARAYSAWLTLTVAYELLARLRSPLRRIDNDEIDVYLEIAVSQAGRPETSSLRLVKDLLQDSRDRELSRSEDAGWTLCDAQATRADDIDLPCERALDALIDGDLRAAASIFRELGQKMTDPAYATDIDWDRARPFPESIMRAAWPPIFEILADDCMAQHASSRGGSRCRPAFLTRSRHQRPLDAREPAESRPRAGDRIIPGDVIGTAIVNAASVVLVESEGGGVRERLSKLLERRNGVGWSWQALRLEGLAFA